MNTIRSDAYESKRWIELGEDCRNGRWNDVEICYYNTSLESHFRLINKDIRKRYSLV